MYGKRLREIREQNQMSQEEVANRLCVSRQAVSKWENEVSQTKGY